MHVIQIDFASPVYDEGFKLRQNNFFEPYQATIELEEIAAEADYIHWGIYTDQAKLVGVAVQFSNQDRKTATLRQLVCQTMAEEQKVELLNAVEAVFRDFGYKKLTIHTPQEAITSYTTQEYIEKGAPLELYGISQQLVQKKL
jgi:hypothetical protein